MHAIVDEMLEDGMKVLAVACKPLPQNRVTRKDERGLILLGYLAFLDAPKKTAAAAISKLHDLHVGVRVLTGDNRDVAASVCRRIGIDTSQILTGKKLEQLSEDALPVQIEYTTVFAEVSPRQKVEILQTLQANGHSVGFLGDGMNDLPAMVEADVGISVDTAAEAGAGERRRRAAEKRSECARSGHPGGAAGRLPTCRNTFGSRLPQFRKHPLHRDRQRPSPLFSRSPRCSF